MHASITTLLESYGYLFLFLFVGVESFGIPVPGETALVAAAAYAALGHLSIYGVVITAATAAIVGDTGGYWIGRRGGLALVKRWGRVLHVNESHITRAHEFFERHGGKTVFIGRFIALLRTWAAVLAGVARMRYDVFFFYNASGGILWAVLFGSLGYLFGHNLPRLEHSIGAVSRAVALFVGLIVVFLLIRRWFRANTTAIAERVARARQDALDSTALATFRRDHSRLWHSVTVRFVRGEYLALHLTLGFAVSLVALWLFDGVTEDVLHHDSITQLNLSILRVFRTHATYAGDSIMGVVSLAGSLGTMGILALVVGIVLTLQRHWLVVAGWTAAFIGGGILDWSLEQITGTPQPDRASKFLHEFSYGFPSGHAMVAVIGYGMLAYLIVTFSAKRRGSSATVIGAAALLIVAIGLSRLYLGVQYFSDVVSGYAAGTLWLAACISGIELVRHQPD